MTYPDEIYLFEQDDIIVWCDTNEAYDPSEAVKYVSFSKYTNLNNQNQELKAHCQRLTRHINKLDKHAYDHEEGGVLNCAVKKQYFESAIQAAEQTPKQSLNEIKAQAIEEMKNEAISTQEKTNKALIDFGEGSRVRKLKAIDLPWINDYINKLMEQ